MQHPHEFVPVSSRQDQATVSHGPVELDSALFVCASGGASVSIDLSIFGNVTTGGGTPIVRNWPSRKLANAPMRQCASASVRDGAASQDAKVVVVTGHTACDGERTAKNYGFVDLVAKKNVELTVADIRQRSPVLAELEANGSIKTVGAMCRLDTGAVDFYRWGRAAQRSRIPRQPSTRYSGIGRSIAMPCAKLGAQLLVSDLDDAGGNETVRGVQQAGGQAQFARTDVADPGDAKALVACAVQAFAGSTSPATRPASAGSRHPPPATRWKPGSS